MAGSCHHLSVILVGTRPFLSVPQKSGGNGRPIVEVLITVRIQIFLKIYLLDLEATFWQEFGMILHGVAWKNSKKHIIEFKAANVYIKSGFGRRRKFPKYGPYPYYTCVASL